MGNYILGTQYDPTWFNIAWSQPSGPYTKVFPQQEIATQYTAYPVPGVLWAENSGTWVVSCNHWVNEPMIFVDYDAYVTNLAYLQDNLGRYWLVGVSNGGIDITATQVSSATVTTVLLQDLASPQTWQLTVYADSDTTDVNYKITPVSGSGGMPQQLCIAPNGGVFGIQVTNGVLQTAYALPSMQQQACLVCCPICTLIQYTIPVATFYSTFLDPVTII